ncbi:hypothetical protein [Pantoea sp.]|uniref:hypothetical protein n=1 Tax=Pantoea sp. TaxID=69393 RepID=UPI003917DC78
MASHSNNVVEPTGTCSAVAELAADYRRPALRPRRLDALCLASGPAVSRRRENTALYRYRDRHLTGFAMVALIRTDSRLGLTLC